MAYDRRDALPVFKLQFEDYPGLTVRVRAPGLDAQLLVEQAMATLSRFGGGRFGLPELKAIKRLSASLAVSLVSWTLTDQGIAVPVSAKELGRLDVEFVLALVRAWLDAITQPRRAAPARTGTPDIEHADVAPDIDDNLTMLPVSANAPDIPDELRPNLQAVSGG